MTQQQIQEAIQPPTLTPRQEIAYQILQESTHPPSAREWGMRVHERQGHHGMQPCEWCSKTGNDLATSLMAKGYARYRLEGGRKFYAVDPVSGKKWRAPEPEAVECCGEYPFCGCAA